MYADNNWLVTVHEVTTLVDILIKGRIRIRTRICIR